MADWTQTITNSIQVFGGGPASEWGTVVGGTDNWGEGSIEITHLIEKYIGNSITPSDSYIKLFEKVYAETLTIASETTDEELFDGSGYNYIFCGPTKEAEDRCANTWTDADIGDVATFTSVSSQGTTWS